MNEPLLSIIIPTYNRPQLLSRAVKSALAQTIKDFEVVVIDDASTETVDLPEHPQLRIVRLPEHRGISATRNAGAKTAKGRWLTFLDDDDELLPDMAKISFNGLKETNLPPPVAVIAGLEMVSCDGKKLATHLPPTLPRGCHFHLEEIEPGKSFFSKQTLVVERQLLLEIGGYDESFSSREHTEMFFRLNAVCSIVGLPIVTYRQLKHSGARLSQNPVLRQPDFYRLIHKHEELFLAHPKMFADFIYNHALISYKLGQKQAAFKNLAWALRVNPLHTLARMGSPMKKLFF